MEGRGNWSRPGDGRPGQSRATAAGWYVDEGWRDGSGGPEEYPEPAGHYGEPGEHYAEASSGRYEESGRYEQSRPDPRADGSQAEPPRAAPVTSGVPSRSDPLRSDPPRPEPSRVEHYRAEAAAGGSPRMSPAEPVRPAQAAARPAPPPVAAPYSPGPVGDNVYRGKRPAARFGFGLVAVLLEIPALLLLVSSTTADPVRVAGVVAAACLACALPLAAVGLYGVVTGAVRAAGPNSVQAWLRPPVAYLTVALVLFVAAGLAA